MNATNFEFDGVAANDIGLYIVSFDGGESGTQDNGGGITYNQSKAINSHKWNLHGSHHETPKTMTFQVCHFDKQYRGKPTPITSKMQAYYERLYQRPTYKYLRFLDGGDDGVDQIYYLCTLNMEWYKVGGTILGIDFTVTCDSPHGYSPIQTFTGTVNTNGTFAILNDSDVVGECGFHDIQITARNAGDVLIEQKLDNQDASGHVRIYNGHKEPMEIKNCSAGEILQINGYTKELITSNTSHLHLADDYNFSPITIITFDDNTSIDPFYSHNSYKANRYNIYTNKGIPIDITLIYRTLKEGVV